MKKFIADSLKGIITEIYFITVCLGGSENFRNEALNDIRDLIDLLCEYWSCNPCQNCPYRNKEMKDGGLFCNWDVGKGEQPCRFMTKYFETHIMELTEKRKKEIKKEKKRPKK